MLNDNEIVDLIDSILDDHVLDSKTKNAWCDKLQYMTNGRKHGYSK